MRRIYKEVIGPETRCTNIALESFGICVGKPLIRASDVYIELTKTFGRESLREYHNPGTYLMSNKEPPKKINVTKVNHFVEWLKAMNAYGHYVVFVSTHAQAFHFLPGATQVWAVDAEEKFVTRRAIESLYEVESPYLDKTFEAFLQNNTRPTKVARL